MINFHIPEIEKNFDMNIRLIDILKDNPKYFYNNIKITGVYGIFGYSLLNGGRTIFGTFTPKNKKESIVQEYNSRGVGIIYTFTNPFITEDMIYDYYTQEDLNIAYNNKINKIIVNSDILHKYLRNNYPEYKLISSITNKRSNNITTFSQGDYDIYIANASLNNTNQIMNIPRKDNIEILLNSQCIRNCKFEQEHYENVVKLTTGEISFEDAYICPYHNHDIVGNPFSLDFMKTLDVFISVGDLYSKYVPAGFNIFKINGRTFPSKEVVEYYLYYLVKPEYKDVVRKELEKYI